MPGLAARLRTRLRRSSTIPQSRNFHSRFGALLKAMNLAESDRTLSINNGFWVHEATITYPEYGALIDRHYGAGLHRVDFRADRKGSAEAINSWVAERTKGRIKGIIQPENIKRDTRAILVNTVYFKADWVRAFNPRNTKEEDFTRADGVTVQLPLMRQQGTFAYVEADGVKAIALPYRGGETEMIVLLPDRSETITALQKSLDRQMSTPGSSGSGLQAAGRSTSSYPGSR
jgi:serpin B